jgi:hypothetical protein
MRFQMPGYDPRPIQSPQNALMQGLEMRRAEQANALQQMQAQAFMQRQQQAQQEQQRAAAMEQQQRQFVQGLPSPRSVAAGNALAGGGGPTVANAQRMAPVDPRQEAQYGAMQAGLMSPMDYLNSVMPAPIKPQRKVVGNAYVEDSGDGVKVLYKPDDKAPALPASAQEYEYAKAQGFRGTFEQWKRGPKVSGGAGGGMSPGAMVEAGGENQLALSKQFGKAAPGYRWKADGSQEAVPGGPADRKNTDAGIREARQREGAVKQAERVIAKVDEALGLVGYNTAGAGGAVMGVVPGTEARDLQATLETVKANLGFAELQAMRDASPTGGALGAIAVQELLALQSTVASLDRNQSPTQLRKSLGDIKKHYTAWKKAVADAGNGEPPAGPAPGSVVDGYRFKGGDPGKPTSWEKAK